MPTSKYIKIVSMKALLLISGLLLYSNNAFAQGENCVPLFYTPLASEFCDGERFIQRSNCEETREAVGTSLIPGCIASAPTSTDQANFPDDPDIARLTSTQNTVVARYQLGDTRAGEGTSTWPVRVSSTKSVDVPIFLRTRKEFENFLEVEAPNSFANAPTPSDPISFCLETDYPPSLSGYTDNSSRPTTCGTHSIAQSRTCSFSTTGSDFPICDECDGVNLNRTISATVAASGGTFTPARSTVCSGQSFTQTRSGGNCNDTRQNTGTRNCSSNTGGGGGGGSGSGSGQGLMWVEVSPPPSVVIAGIPLPGTRLFSGRPASFNSTNCSSASAPGGVTFSQIIANNGGIACSVSGQVAFCHYARFLVSGALGNDESTLYFRRDFGCR